MNNTNKKVKLLLSNYLNNKICIKKLNEELTKLISCKGKENITYLNSLLYPEKSKGCRIPSDFPIKSCTFQLKGSFTIPIQYTGTFLIRINPFWLCSSACYGADMRIDWNYPSGNVRVYCANFNFFDLSTIQYADALIDGHGGTINTRDVWRPLSSMQKIYSLPLEESPLGKGYQTVPEGTYEQYRLVSGSTEVKYIGSLDTVSGIIGGSIILEDTPGLSSVCSYESKQNAKPDFKENSASPEENLGPVIDPKFYDFNYFRHCLYHCENTALEGVRMLYFPPDNSYNEFIRVFNGTPYSEKKRYLGVESNLNRWFAVENEDYNKDGFWWYIYGENLPTNSEQYAIQVKYCFNFECLPSSSFLDYCPVDSCPFSLNDLEKKKIYEEVQKMATQKIK